MVMFSSAGTRTRCATCAKRANSPARSRAGICAAR
jgi:ribosomal protein S27E